MIRVLVADDHPLVRAGLRHVLAEEADFSAPGEAADCEQVLRRIDEQLWDVVVLDIVLPDRSGLEALPEIRRRCPGLPVLILSVHSEEQFALRAMRAGAFGYISKSDSPAELVRAIRKVVGGKKYVSSKLAEELAETVEPGRSRHALHEDLSDREFQVMCRIASGKTVSEIAREISLSVKTVSTYRARALEKMKMGTNSQFTRYAIQNGLVD